MKRYDLLFRYLDGEITRDEDKTLREVIKNDPELGEDFQSFLEIDYHINKINDEFEYPDDFLNEVGNKISNQMVLDNELNQMRKQVRRQYATRFLLVPAMIATFFFAFLISVQNPEIDLLNFSLNRNSGTDVINQPSADSQEINVISSAQKTLSNPIYSNRPISIAKVEQNNDNKAKFIGEIVEKDEISINNDETTNTTNHSIILAIEQTKNSDEPILNNKSNENAIEYQGSISNTNFALNLPINNNLNSEDFYINPKFQSFNSGLFQSALVNNSNIEINSLLGTDLVQIGVNSTNQIISSFTQSFAAEITNGSSLGLEAGYMEFKSNAKKITEISKPNKGGLNGYTVLELENNSSDNPVLIRVEGIEVVNQRLFWVGLFYERNFLNYENFNISSRISLGASDNGVISSLKFLAKYNLTRGIILTFGTDAKIFEGSFNENQINRINSAFSLIYGVKFSF